MLITNMNLEFTNILFTFAHLKFAFLIINDSMEMDIATRLRQFMAYRNIASSQFADNADIPRPTLSQLLNGRNKKISNELIGKIHEAFPSLNVMWLMFGEGDMECEPNMKTSEPQKNFNFTPDEMHEPNYEAVFIAQAPDYDRNTGRQSQHNVYKPVPHPVSQERPAVEDTVKSLGGMGAKITDTARVQQIMVLYTDGRFETFRPAEQ